MSSASNRVVLIIRTLAAVKTHAAKQIEEKRVVYYIQSAIWKSVLKGSSRPVLNENDKRKTRPNQGRATVQTRVGRSLIQQIATRAEKIIENPFNAQGTCAVIY